jgi:hypothetical protein
MRNTFCSRFKGAKRETIVPAEIMSDWATIDAPQEWRTRILEFVRALGHLSDEQREALFAVVSWRNLRGSGEGCGLRHRHDQEQDQSRAGAYGSGTGPLNSPDPA